MLSMILWIIVFVASLFFLVKSADYFTDYCEKLALYLGAPAFIIGVTIAAIGTSLPELITSIFSVIYKHSEIVAGNAIGSNIANILLIVGLCAIISKDIKFEWDLLRVDLPLLIGSAFLISIFIFDGIFTYKEAILCILAYLVYFFYSKEAHKKNKLSIRDKKAITPLKTFLFLVSVAALYFSSKYLVVSIVELSKAFEIGADVIAATAVAIGTSLPELMVSVFAIKKRDYEIAIGNIIGSNIFNSLLVFGIPGLIGTLVITDYVKYFALPFMLVISLLFFFVSQDKEITKWEGLLFMIFYISFLLFTIGAI